MNDPQSTGQTHWTGVKLWGYLKDVESINLGYASLTRLLYEENFCLKVPRSWSDKQDAVLREQFKKDISIHLKNKDLEVWYCDESGFLADPRPRRVWAARLRRHAPTSTCVKQLLAQCVHEAGHCQRL